MKKILYILILMSFAKNLSAMEANAPSPSEFFDNHDMYSNLNEDKFRHVALSARTDYAFLHKLQALVVNRKEGRSDNEAALHGWDLKIKRCGFLGYKGVQGHFTALQETRYLFNYKLLPRQYIYDTITTPRLGNGRGHMGGLNLFRETKDSALVTGLKTAAVLAPVLGGAYYLYNRYCK